MGREDDVFEKLETHDEAELVGARWWRRALASRGPELDRRSALIALAGLSAASAAMGTSMLQGCSRSPADADADIRADALESQRKYGWDFGAEGQGLILEGTASDPVDPAVLDGLVETLMPKNPAHQPFYGPVLFQSLTHTPTSPINGPGQQLRDVIRPVRTQAMEQAILKGRGLSTLFEEAPPGRIVVIDLPGDQAVGFATGLANRFDPVFWFDNWPHPRGVVPSHLTLASVLAVLPELEELADSRPETAPPAYVLDANRLLRFDDETLFDNRYVARLPSAQQLEAAGVKQIVYVRPTGTDRELDDLNDLFTSYRAAQIEVKLVPADGFIETPPPEGETAPMPEKLADAPAEAGDHYHTSHNYYGHYPHYYYGSPLSHWFFFSHFGWGRPSYAAIQPTHYRSPPDYTPTRRATSFSGGKPSGFGQVNTRRSASGRPTLSPSQSKPSTLRPSSGRSSSGGGRSSWGRSGGGTTGA